MTPREKMDEVYRLNAKRNKLTLINMLGVFTLLGIQFSIAYFVKSQWMLLFPLLVVAWGIFFVVAIIRLNIKQRRLIKEISEDVREHQASHQG